jgi:ABC-2 type transport system ATP-binding protein
VSIRGLHKSFGDFTAVDDIDLDIRPGEVFGLLGPNGAGKTTTINMLSTLLTIGGGKAEIFGVDVARHPHRIRQLIGVTGQYASVDEKLTGRENLRLIARLQGLSRAAAQSIAAELLDEFGLAKAADKPLSTFSGGMRRRLDLAVSLISRPPLIFLDEPTTGLDPRTRNQMWETIRGLVASGVTVLLTTQYLEEADQLADRIAVIDHGNIVAQGAPAELKASIGGSSLRVGLDTETSGDGSERAQAVISDIVGADAVHTSGPAEITVSLQQAGDAASVLVALREAGIDVASIKVAEPSLDDVFLTITGEAPADASTQPHLTEGIPA